MASQALKYTITVDVIFHKLSGDIITDPPVPFRSDRPTILGKYDIADIDENISNCSHKLQASNDSYTENGSGWRFETVFRAEIKLMQYEPVVGNKVLPLTPYIAKKHAIINIDNNREMLLLVESCCSSSPREGPTENHEIYRI